MTGDKLVLGNCTLEYQIGDSMELMKDMDDNSVDLVLTDIPYNISQDSNGLRNLDYGGWDKQGGMETNWICSMERLVNKSIIVFCGKSQFGLILDYLLKFDYLVRPIVWCKPNPTVLNCDKMMIEATEFAVYGKKHGATWNSTYQKNYFNAKPPLNRTHPTQKPLDIFEKLIELTTDPGDTVLDPFLGSGTTLLACRKTGRNGKGFEINPDYEPIIRKRIMADIPKDIFHYGGGES